MEFNIENLIECFEFLDELRESGATNMFGAAAYLEDEFSIDAKLAKKINKTWMRTFNDEAVKQRAKNGIDILTEEQARKGE